MLARQLPLTTQRGIWNFTSHFLYHFATTSHMLLYSFSNLYTYDIFQRHCFGNYYGKLNTSALNAQFLDSTNLLFFSFRHVDILKEMSYLGGSGTVVNLLVRVR